ncbi:MAG: hypothetical protein HZC01_04060 [Candidatus Kerfeldbacteria bacterium]|nr:hypothetical protein [Candidatus Kerfeldbacteria bacterium]
MKCTILRIAQGKTAQPAIVVELTEVELRATYADVLAAAKIRFDENTMQLMYGHPGDSFFSGSTSPDSYVVDGEVIGIFDLGLFETVSHSKTKPA